MSSEIYSAMANSVINGEVGQAEELAREAVRNGLDALEAINQGFVEGVNQVGESFSCGDAFLPDLVLAGEAMKAALGVLEPELAKGGQVRETLGVIVLGTIEGDIHDIGKTLVGTMLSIAGFEVIDLGVDVPIPELIAKAREVKADLVGISSLLTTTMARGRDLIEALDDLGLRPELKVMVGGAPVSQSWADEIGADGYSEDAIGAVALAKELVGKE